MYVIKIGLLYFDGSRFTASQRDAKRFHSASSTFRDYVTLLFGDARFVKLVPKRHDVSPMDDFYNDDSF
jgi:hypothetical protein